MSITKDFDAMLAEKAGVRPTFKAGGQEFTLRARLPFTKWNNLLAVMRSDETDNMAATEQFFDTVLIKADRQRFKDLLAYDGEDDEDDERVLDLLQLNELTDWAMEIYTGKLQSSSSGSTPGSNGTGQPPNVVSLSRVQNG